MSPNQAYMNLRQAAEYLGIPYATAAVSWAGWEKWGVIPSRRNGRKGGVLMFQKKLLDQMVEEWQVSK